MSSKGQTPAAENRSNWLEMIFCIDRGVGNHMHTKGPMNIESVAEKPVVAASETKVIDEVRNQGLGPKLVGKQTITF